ncbi:MAG: hypothetical protein JF564_08000, partial [Sphingomonas sp.]|nr:hypothetical protein [Sphingomonas sp.]
MFNDPNNTSDYQRLAGSFASAPSGDFQRLAAPIGPDPYAAQRPQGTTAPLPAPPPSASGRRSTIWDKQHISETLAGIGQAFLSNQNFGEGLGAVAGVIGNRQHQLRDDTRKSVTYGGPDNQFAITTDPASGDQSIRKVPEFAEAVEAERRARYAPTPKENADMRSRVLYSIGALPAEQRATAYQHVIANPAQYSVDPATMPGQWSDEYGTVGAGLGMNVNQSLSQQRNDAVAADRVAANRRRLEQGDQRLQQGAARVAQGAERLRQSPPSTRKGYSMPKSRADF